MSGYIRYLTCAGCQRTFRRPPYIHDEQLDITWKCDRCRVVGNQPEEEKL